MTLPILSCLTLKAAFGLPLRKTIGFAQSLLRLVRLSWAAHSASQNRRSREGIYWGKSISPRPCHRTGSGKG
ncbi:hypothetical protein DS909_09780 [Phaeobacter gallaeciensis]|uniref:Transposase DDE domain-containing protein n=2 Tax=Roseobacteraceae TaxID=2854170 RepID=A0A366X0E5_9RHOB|nr:transposase [Falsiruegeria litorea]MBT8169463.1 transposase [Falsiruegeria litorea]RBW55912.1 hypothetical protein DS909_09780 [Phaeobacter gallaeciensis]